MRNMKGNSELFIESMESWIDDLCTGCTLYNELFLLKVILTRLGFSKIAKVKYGLFLLKFILTRSGVMEIV